MHTPKSPMSQDDLLPQFVGYEPDPAEVAELAKDIDTWIWGNYNLSEPYEGYAFVLFKGTDGKYYEVYASHCSCFGLEGQWDPDEVDLAHLEREVATQTSLLYYETEEYKADLLALIRQYMT